MSASVSASPTIRVYEPHAEESSDQDALAKRASSYDGKVIGLLRRSIAYEWLKNRGLTCADKLSALPLAKPFLIPPETPVPDLVETLMRSAVSKALVVDSDQKLLGIVTLFDLLKGGRQESGTGF